MCHIFRPDAFGYVLPVKHHSQGIGIAFEVDINARRLAEGLAGFPALKIDPEKVVTNIVIVEVSGGRLTADQICASLQQRGVLASGFGSAIRMVTHYDVSRADIETALNEIRKLVTGQ